MELLIEQVPFASLSGELVVMDRTPAEQYKLQMLKEIFTAGKVTLVPASQVLSALWLYAGRESDSFSVGMLRKSALGLRVEGPLVAQLPAAQSTWTLDETFARASYRLKFTEQAPASSDAVVVRDSMVLYRKGSLTWILGGAPDSIDGLSPIAMELASVAAVAIALGASAKEIASALRRFRASEYAYLESALLLEVEA